jgi:dTDP-3-amino-3,4,6-trideoxy-alpha-D-glucose transaminase
MVRPSPGLYTEVPFVDLGPSCRPLNEAILADIAELLESTRFHYGPQVAEFEERFASYCGAAHCVGMSSGLDALRLALLAAGIEPGDEVIVPANTFIATFAAVHQAGGIPVPVDASETDYNLDPALVAQAVTDRTRFVVPVHLYGQMADMRALSQVADRLGLVLIEDACQAHGAERGGVRAGAGGRAAAFSFYPSKNLGAAGDAGAAVTSDDELAVRLRALRHHGEREKYRSEVEGYTARLDTIQAIILLHKLPHLDGWTDARRAAAAFYTDALAGVGDLRLPPIASGGNPVWHLYVARTAEPEALAGHLAARGIGSGRHYPEPPHLARAFAWLGKEKGDFPVAEAVAAEGLSLPLFPGISEEQLEAVAGAVAEYFG